VAVVLRYLHRFVEKSRILHTLENEKQGITEQRDSPDYDFDDHPVYKMLGYFSVIGLLRVHCLLGDYYLALKTLDSIDLSKKGLFTRVTACYITLYYYLGFAYLMMRRYADAIKTFSTILLYISRAGQYHTRSYQYDQMMKKNEQMYALLAITVSLCPQRIDENVHSILREKYSDKLTRMQRGESTIFEELFSYACPKFINPIPNYDNELLANHNYQEPLRLQLKIFMNEVKQQIILPILRSFLKLYTTIPLPKLADFLEIDQDTLRTYLLCYKHKTHNLVWTPGEPAVKGKWASLSDVNFIIDGDMVHIQDAKVEKRYGDFFIRHINKFQEIVNEIKTH